MTANQIIEKFRLEPLPGEGGYYRQTYKARGKIPEQALQGHVGERSYGTAIYYLVTPESFSALHWVPQDEVFHFYLGDAVEMLQLHPDGQARMCRIGTDLAAGDEPQVVAPGGVWQGTRLVDGGSWALLGCTVCPGFEFADFRMETRSELTERFPQHAELVRRFTHG